MGRNKMHLYLPTGPGAGNGQPSNGDGGANSGANGGGGNGGGGNNGPQNDGGGSSGTGGGNDTPPGNGAPQNGNQGGGDVPIEQLPEGWQRHIRELRGENQTRRGNEQTLTADRDKYKTFYDSVHGVVNPTDQRDPQQLAADIATEKQGRHESDRKLAIYQMAGEHGADATALLDSDSFLRSVRDLDPSAQDFSSQIGERIKTAVENNGRLKASTGNGNGNRQNNGGNGNGNGQQRPGNSGSTEFPGGAGGNQLTREDLKGMSPEAIEKARVDGRLKTLLGG